VLTAPEAAEGDQPMKTYTIENETNNITLHTSSKDAESVPAAERFSNEAALAKLAADWPASRLVEIWNSLPGVNPVKKFTNRHTAVSRIWKAIQNLGISTAERVAQEPEPEAAHAEPPTVTDNTMPVAEPDTTGAVELEPIAETAIETPAETAEAPAATTPEPADVPAPIAAQTPDVAPEMATPNPEPTRAKKARKTADKPKATREGSKTGQVIAMLKREGGTTIEEIMTVMGWQKHTTRAMLSAGGSLTKNHGLVVVSERVGETRRYSIKA
jgi:hypothetical protein